MRKILRHLAVYLLFIIFIPSCDSEDCKDCKQIVDNCGSVTEGTPIRTCGDELTDRENDYSIVGCVESYWECN